MPFIVTTKRPGAQAHEVRDLDCIVVSRVAVATLEDAQREARTITLPYALVVQPADDKAITAQIDALPESGGTVGPLPDGSLIEVELVGWLAIYEPLRPFPAAKPFMQWTRAEILGAFNAREAGHA